MHRFPSVGRTHGRSGAAPHLALPTALIFTVVFPQHVGLLRTAEEEVTSKTSETLAGRSTMHPAPVLPCSSGPLAASARQGEQATGRQDHAG
jgi:hypothetical protein